jgi:UDP-3-O-acyl N-acetylglucosamine deacetylase
LFYTPRKQRTVRTIATVSGFGYWSGADVRVEFRPAAPNSGIVFVRQDLTPPRRIPAVVQNRVEVPRRTSLRAQGASVEMVEHVLAALAGLQIDNCEVWVDAAEMPGLDGSSLPFVTALEAAGSVEQDAERQVLVIRELTRLGDDESWVEAHPPTEHGLSLMFRLDYGRGNPIGKQTFRTQLTPDVFRRELASSRTFLLQSEAEWLRSQGLGLRAGTDDLLVFDDEGPVNNSLRFSDECARHKTLDLVGDLALSGCDVVGRIVAHRSGHRLNAELVQALLRESGIHDGWRRSA